MHGVMLIPRIFLAPCVALLLAPALSAQTPRPEPASVAEPAASSPQEGRSGSHVSEGQAMQWFNMLDANHDGCILRGEAGAAILFYPRLAREFEETDTNRDGCITPDEIRAQAERRRAERQARQKPAGQAAPPGTAASMP